jgi:O-antigen/teichoic acid export membrane protein
MERNNDARDGTVRRRRLAHRSGRPAVTVPTPDHTGTAARGAFALSLVLLTSRGLAAVFVVVVGRVVGAEGFARYSVAASVVTLCTVLADFGTTPIVTRRIAREPTEAARVLRAALPISIVTGFALQAGAALFAVVSRYDATLRTDVLIGSMAIPLMSVATTYMAALDGLGQIARRSRLNLGIALVTFVGGAVPVVLHQSVRWSIAALAVAPLVALIAGRRWVRAFVEVGSRTRPTAGELRALVRGALPLAGLAAVSAVSTRLDILLLSILSTATETASYDVAVRIVEALAFVATTLTAPALFLFNRQLGAGDVDGAERSYQQAARLLYIIGIPISAVVAANAPELVRTLVGSTYTQAAVALAILGGASVLYFIALLQGALLVSSDRLHHALVTAALLTTGLAVLDIALIAPFGAAGAAWATLVTHLATVVTFAMCLRRWIGVRTPLPHPGAVGAGLVAAGLAWATPAKPWLSVPFALIAYALGTHLTRAWTLSDTRGLLTRLRSA